MAYDFDRVIERRYTESSKWRKYGEDVIPLWVADMDFASPAPVIRALRERVEHRVFRYGYTLQRSPLHDLFADRREELGRMAELCLARGLAIVADEIHSDLVFPPHRHVPIASLDPAIAGRTITLMAPSKTWNLAGLKFGLAVIPNAALRERFAAARADLVYGVNVLGYTAALAAYRDGEPWLEELLRYLGANRDFLVDYVRRRLAGVAVAPPDATYLAWLDCRDAAIPGGDPFTFFLETARVALNDGTAFGRSGQGFVRLNFGCPRTILTEGLDRMRAALAALP